ncbi:hypothetical protein CYLTODRAFT_441879 [Cylindrobasidium torrendii FP15055 ss-10]|uniref:Uncharacterized protein n=1 Tax=Cylindrobasidium torrendii FP15055 ss-10 TaxID=1314674 RepID=A0A0D7BJ87_9AGAR|nr:hypothetical protein CYLTODRAFT_441879 [Cylindrobasidium torrendii FP15055 ss-10]
MVSLRDGGKGNVSDLRSIILCCMAFLVINNSSSMLQRATGVGAYVGYRSLSSTLLRFYAATIATQEQQRRVASSPRVGGIFDREGETEDDVETRDLTPLSTQERTEMDYLATDIAAILENYAAERQKFYNRYEQEERYQRDVGRSQSIDRGRKVASGGLRCLH